FLQSRGPQEAAPWNNPVVTCIQFCHRCSVAHQPLEVPFMPSSLRMHVHGPELKNRESSTSEANAFLPVENGAGRRNLDCRHHDEHEWQPNRVGQHYQREIESSLPPGYPVPTVLGRGDATGRL